jgi:RNA polymerase sigma-70 factor, ECF subfamily
VDAVPGDRFLVTSDSGRDLIARARTGDADAFGQIYDEYAARIFRFMLAQVREPSDAEDLTSQVFLKVVRSLGRYEERGVPFGAWLFRIARTTLIDSGRRTRPTVPLDRMPHQPRAEDQGDALARAADVIDIRAALDLLSPDQRDVILLRFFAGLSVREVGLLLGKRQGNVAVLQHRALVRLRRSLADERTWKPAGGEATA